MHPSSDDRQVRASGGAQPPGWYMDPWGAAAYRWWDGTAWTGDLSPADPAGSGRSSVPTGPGPAGVDAATPGEPAGPASVIYLVGATVVFGLLVTVGSSAIDADCASPDVGTLQWGAGWIVGLVTVWVGLISAAIGVEIWAVGRFIGSGEANRRRWLWSATVPLVLGALVPVAWGFFSFSVVANCGL